MLWANILDYTQPEDRQRDDGRTWVTVDPDLIYPAVIKHFKECQAEGTPAHPKCLDRYYLEAAFLPGAALGLALVPFGRLIDARERLVHDQALEIARLWFTSAIQYAINGPIGINILNRPEWRLYYV